MTNVVLMKEFEKFIEEKESKPKRDRTVEKYEALIAKASFTERELISFRKLVNGSSRLSKFDAQLLIDAFNAVADIKGVKLTKEQQLKGIDWLRNVTFKLNGQVRKSAPLAYFEQEVVKNFKKFTCVGLYDLSTNNYRQVVPIYRCIARNGLYFDYVCMMWGDIKVISLGDSNGSISHANQPEWELARQGTQSSRIA